MRKKEVLMRTEDLCKYYPVKKQWPWQERREVHAVDGISLTVYQGETIGIVGESGCGKSTFGQCLLMLQKPTSGQIWYQGEEISTWKERKLRALRGEIQMVFQDPYSSLDPSRTVFQIVAEPLEAQAVLGNYPKEQIRGRVKEMLELVGLGEDVMSRFPHEFSGGQRQRIGIARAFACAPKLVVCDEAVSALDVSIQAQIINLLQDLQERTGVSYLFISHDLGVVRHISDRIVVLYLGQIVEEASKEALFEQPVHPYTRTLLEAIPLPDPEKPLQVEEGVIEFPDPLAVAQGCRFCLRCPFAQELCKTKQPERFEVEPGHFVACHRAKELVEGMR